MMIAEKRSSSWRIVIEIVLILVALVIGYFLHPISNLEVDPKASIIDYANIAVTLTALIFIPYYIEKKLKEKRVIKDLLIDDIKENLQKVNKLRNLIRNCSISGETTKTDRSEILGFIRSIDNSNGQIINMLESVFGIKKVQPIKNSLYQLSDNLWSEITDGDLMKEGFKIDDDFSSMASKECLKYTSKYKSEVIKINNL